MCRVMRFLVLMYVCVSASVSLATVVTDLNVANVPVKEASAVERSAVMPSAIKQVLIKISGNPSVMTLPAVQNALTRVDCLIQSYSYARHINSEGQAELSLQVTFDQAALDSILQKAGQALWSNDRPLTLVSLQIQRGNENTPLSSDSRSALIQVVKQRADARGVPILFPSMDLQDQSAMNPSADAPFDVAQLQAMTKRYAASAVLAGQVSGRADGRWEGRWLLWVNGAPYRWDTAADNIDSAVAKAVSDMADLMANQLAVENASDLQSNVTMVVDNVSDLRDYSAAMHIIQHLAPVASVAVKDMTGSGVLLQIKTRGGQAALVRALSEQHKLAEEQVPGSAPNTSADLYYRWVSGPSSHATVPTS